MAERKPESFLLCWGSGEHGQHGHIVCGDRTGKVDVPSRAGQLELSLGAGPSNPLVTAVACGSSHTVVVTDDNELYAWGHGYSKCCLCDRKESISQTPSQLKIDVDGDSINEKTLVSGLCSGGRQTVAWLRDGRAFYIDGLSTQESKLTDGASRRNESPHSEGKTLKPPLHTLMMTGVRLPIGSQVEYVACGDRHSLFLMQNKDVYASGNNTYGQLGTGDRIESNVPKQINLKLVQLISCGSHHSMAVTVEGDLLVWGYGKAIGYREADVLHPTRRVKHHTNIKMLAAGGAHCLALTVNGNIYSWGVGVDGQLGHGADDNFVAAPKKLVDPRLLGRVTSISAGDLFSAATTVTGELFMWGKNSHTIDEHQLPAARIFAPLKVDTAGHPVKAVTCGAWHAACIVGQPDEITSSARDDLESIWSAELSESTAMLEGDDRWEQENLAENLAHLTKEPEFHVLQLPEQLKTNNSRTKRRNNSHQDGVATLPSTLAGGSKERLSSRLKSADVIAGNGKRVPNGAAGVGRSSQTVGDNTRLPNASGELVRPASSKPGHGIQLLGDTETREKLIFGENNFLGSSPPQTHRLTGEFGQRTDAGVDAYLHNNPRQSARVNLLPTNLEDPDWPWQTGSLETWSGWPSGAPAVDFSKLGEKERPAPKKSAAIQSAFRGSQLPLQPLKAASGHVEAARGRFSAGAKVASEKSSASSVSTKRLDSSDRAETQRSNNRSQAGAAPSPLNEAKSTHIVAPCDTTQSEASGSRAGADCGVERRSFRRGVDDDSNKYKLYGKSARHSARFSSSSDGISPGQLHQGTGVLKREQTIAGAAASLSRDQRKSSVNKDIEHADGTVMIPASTVAVANASEDSVTIPGLSFVEMYDASDQQRKLVKREDPVSSTLLRVDAPQLLLPKTVGFINDKPTPESSKSDPGYRRNVSIPPRDVYNSTTTSSLATNASFHRKKYSRKPLASLNSVGSSPGAVKGNIHTSGVCTGGIGFGSTSDELFVINVRSTGNEGETKGVALTQPSLDQNFNTTKNGRQLPAALHS